MSGTISGMGTGNLSQAVSGMNSPMPLEQKMNQLFQQIDTQGTGSITKDQFEAAFQKMKLPPQIKSMGADELFKQLDPNGTGKVSQEDFVKGMKNIAVAQFQSQRQGGVGAPPPGAGAPPPPPPGTGGAQGAQGAQAGFQLQGAFDQDGDRDGSGKPGAPPSADQLYSLQSLHMVAGNRAAASSSRGVGTIINTMA